MQLICASLDSRVDFNDYALTHTTCHIPLAIDIHIDHQGVSETRRLIGGHVSTIEARANSPLGGCKRAQASHAGGQRGCTKT